MSAIGAEALRDLGRELAGGAEHKNAAALAPSRAAIGGQAVDDRQRECGRLACARLGDAEYVAPGEDDRDGFGLDGGRRFVAFVLQRLEDRRGEAEIGKDLSIACSFSVAAHDRLTPTMSERGATARSSCLETPRVSWVVGWKFSGRSTGGRAGPACPLLSSFTRLERRKSLIERWRLVSCRGCTSQTLSMLSLRLRGNQSSSGGNFETINCCAGGPGLRGIAHSRFRWDGDVPGRAYVAVQQPELIDCTQRLAR